MEELITAVERPDHGHRPSFPHDVAVLRSHDIGTTRRSTAGHTESALHVASIAVGPRDLRSFHVLRSTFDRG